MESVLGPVEIRSQRPQQNDDRHLRSAGIVRTYRVLSSDGQSQGRLADYVIEDQDWTVPYLRIQTNRLSGAHLLIPTSWITNIDWDDGVAWSDTQHRDWQELPRFRQRALP